MPSISTIKPGVKSATEYILTIIKWILFSLALGLFGGLSGVLFHYSVDIASNLRNERPYILFLLPIAGVIIVFLYHLCKMDNDSGTNAIIRAVRSSDKISILVAPLILVSTALTHLCGGSAGREGAALQIGGSIGSSFAKLLKFKEYNTSVAIMCGMSALFSAVFGTPLTAAVFALEVISVGIMHYSALLPSVLSAVIAVNIASYFGVHKTHFVISQMPSVDFITLGQVILLALLIALISILFIITIHKSTHFMAKKFPNKYLRIIIGALAVILLTLVLGTREYNGAGMESIINAVENGTASPFAFILKLLFTAVTLSAGFKGGEIVPTFFIGSTFGVFIAPLLGLNPSFAAAIGLVALFCGVVNCPIASIILSIELFGAEGILYFAVAVAVSYIISGYYSLYSGQKIVYSKLHSAFIDMDAK